MFAFITCLLPRSYWSKCLLLLKSISIWTVMVYRSIFFHPFSYVCLNSGNFEVFEQFFGSHILICSFHLELMLSYFLFLLFWYVYQNKNNCKLVITDFFDKASQLLLRVQKLHVTRRSGKEEGIYYGIVKKNKLWNLRVY